MGEKWKKKLKTQLKYGIKNSGFRDLLFKTLSQPASLWRPKFKNNSIHNKLKLLISTFLFSWYLFLASQALLMYKLAAFHENSQHSRIENHFHPGMLCSLKLTIESLKFWNFRWQNLYSFEIHNTFSIEFESRHLTSYSNRVFYFKSDLRCKTSHFPIIYFYKSSYLSRLG